MSNLYKRRHFIKCCTALSLAAARQAWGANTSPSGLSATELATNIYLIHGAGSNVIARIGSKEVLLVDGGLAEHSQALLALVTGLSNGLPISTLFNTHWHWNHTGSNEAIKQQGAEIIAHENTRLWLGAEIISQTEQRIYPPRSEQALPTLTFFYGHKSLRFEHESIEYGYLAQAHTDGDIYVRFPDSNILVVGDTLSVARYPTLDYSTGGWIGGLISATRTLLALCDEKTKVIPGTGSVQSKADLQAQLDMCEAIRESIANNYRQAIDYDEWLASQPSQAFDQHWGSPQKFLEQAYKGANGHIRELGGIF